MENHLQDALSNLEEETRQKLSISIVSHFENPLNCPLRYGEPAPGRSEQPGGGNQTEAVHQQQTPRPRDREGTYARTGMLKLMY